MGERGIVYRILVGKFERKRPLGRHRHRWEDNTHTSEDKQEVDCGVTEWNKLAQERDSWQAFVNAIMILRVP